MLRHALWVFAAIALAIGTAHYWDATQAGASGTRTPVLVELFTSEGCSDCPPADRVLAELMGREPVQGVDVVAMSEHVDYWNQLGWSDPFSDPQFSKRQDEYARRFGRGNIYTPQMVVDGQIEFVGSNQAQAVQAIRRMGLQAKNSITITAAKHEKDGVQLQIHADQLNVHDQAAEVFLAITENNLLSKVARGENRGRTLTHVGVVRKLIPIGKISATGSFSAAPVVHLLSPWKLKDLQAVAFIQEKTTGHILAVSSTPIESD